MPYVVPALVIVAAYALGGFVAAYYWYRWRTGRDIRGEASGNAGARNIGRLLGPGAFALVFVIDAAKGGLAVGLARCLSLCKYTTTAVLLAVICGHVWPVQLGFRGGKGLATAFGAMFVYDPLIAGIQSGITVIFTGLTRRSVWSLLLALVAGPVVAVFLGRSGVHVAGIAFLGSLLAWTHRENLRRDSQMKGHHDSRLSAPAQDCD